MGARRNATLMLDYESTDADAISASHCGWHDGRAAQQVRTVPIDT